MRARDGRDDDVRWLDRRLVVVVVEGEDWSPAK